MADLPEATTTSELFLAHLVDANIEQLGITIQTNRLRLRVQVHLFTAAHNNVNIAHVSGTKARSTLTRTEFTPTQGRRRP